MKMAMVDYNRCHPEECRTCSAAAACTRKLMIQESHESAPMPDPFMCKGCGDCVRACPLKAITITTQ